MEPQDLQVITIYILNFCFNISKRQTRFVLDLRTISGINVCIFNIPMYFSMYINDNIIDIKILITFPVMLH